MSYDIIEPAIYIAFCIQITKSVAYHGFRKIVLVNGHGSNTPLNDLIARKTVLGTNALCAAVNYFALALDTFAAAGGASFIAHADEFETSLYLHLAPERVRMDKAVALASRQDQHTQPIQDTILWSGKPRNAWCLHP